MRTSSRVISADAARAARDGGAGLEGSKPAEAGLEGSAPARAAPRARSAGAADLQQRLQQLSARHDLPPQAVSQFWALLLLLAHDPQAPTAVIDPSQALDVHLADSLVALDLPALRAARRLADVGSGAGFPGLALAVAVPAGEVSLIESQARKCAFLRRAVESADLGNARVIQSRVEEWGEGIGAHHVVLARAVAPQPVVLEYAAPLLGLGGVLVDWRGRRRAAEEHQALEAAAQLGLERIEVRRVSPFRDAQDRHLHLFAKVARTPDRFPRRAGLARKRPLGR